MRGRIVVVGSLNADLVVRVERLPRAGETVRGSELAVLPGGKGANQAAAAGRLGAEVIMIGAVGDDAHGQLLLDAARAAGVDVGRIRRLVGAATGTALICVDSHAENSIIISPGANGRLTPGDLSDDDFAEAAVLCLSLEVPLDTVTAAADRARRAGTTVVCNLSPFQPVPKRLLQLTDVLLVNEIELAELTGTTAGRDWPSVIDLLDDLGIGTAVVTLGADGAVVLDRGAAQPVTPIGAPVVAAIDTTGCGDAFTGALACRIADGDDLVAAAGFATRVAALAATKQGAQASYPDIETVLAFR